MRGTSTESDQADPNFYPHTLLLNISALKMDLLKRTTTNSYIDRLFRAYDETAGHVLGVTFVQEGTLHSVEDWLNRILTLMGRCFQEHRKDCFKVRDGEVNAKLIKALSEHASWVLEQASNSLTPDNLASVARPFTDLEAEYNDLLQRQEHIEALADERAHELETLGAEHSSMKVELSGQIETLSQQLAVAEARAAERAAKEAELLAKLEKLMVENADLQTRLSAEKRSPLTDITEENQENTSQESNRRSVTFAKSVASSSYLGSICEKPWIQSYTQSVAPTATGQLSPSSIKQRKDLAIFLSPFTTLCVDALRVLPRGNEIDNFEYRLPFNEVSAVDSSYLPERPPYKLKTGTVCTLVRLQKWLPDGVEVPSNVELPEGGSQVVLDKLALLLGTELISPELILDPNLLDFQYRYQLLLTKLEQGLSNPAEKENAIAALKETVRADEQAGKPPLAEMFNEAFKLDIQSGSQTPTPSAMIPKVVMDFLTAMHKQVGFSAQAANYCAGFPPVEKLQDLDEATLLLFSCKSKSLQVSLSKDRYYLGSDDSLQNKYSDFSTAATKVYNGKRKARKERERQEQHGCKSSENTGSLLGGQHGTFRQPRVDIENNPKFSAPSVSSSGSAL